MLYKCNMICFLLLYRSEVGDEEEMDFHLEATDDISWDDDNILPARYPSSLEVKK